MQYNKQEKSPIKQNILLYLEHKGVSPYIFYKESGVTRGVLAQNNGISEDNIARFLAYAPDVNIVWLLTGEGPMLNDQSAALSTPTLVAHGEHTDETGIPLIPLNAMAGALSGTDSQIMPYDCESYNIPAFKGADFLIHVKGDSMEPTFRSGDIVACRRVALSNIFFQWNKVYVLDTDQGPLIKRIRRAKDNDHILIVSDNQDYDPFELHLSQLHAICLVVGMIRPE